MKQRSTVRWILPTLTLFIPLRPAMAWNEKGHGLVAETAASLLEKKWSGWQQYLSSQKELLKKYSYYPDHPFRDISQNGAEAPNHFFHLDSFPSTGPNRMLNLPEDCRAAQNFIVNSSDKKIQKAGTAPWRIEQFRNMAWNELRQVKFGSDISVNNEKHLKMAVYYLGLMSHYTADIFVPYHGIDDSAGDLHEQHLYIENCTDQLVGDLAPEVRRAAEKTLQDTLKKWKFEGRSVPKIVINRLRESVALLKPFNEAYSHKDPKKGCDIFRPLLVERLASAAVFTAYLYDSALPPGVSLPRNPVSPAESDLILRPDYPAFECVPQSPAASR